LRLLFGKISLFDDEDRGEEGWREAEDNLDIFLEDTEPLFVRMSRFGNFPSKPFATRTGENENLFRLVDSAIVEILGRLLFAFGFIPGGGMLFLLGLFNVSIKRGWFLFTRPLVEGVTVPLLFFEEFLKEEFFFNFLIKDLASNSSKLLSSTVRSTVGGGW